MIELPDGRLLFFGGKGGVGKTTLAAASAIQLAERGDRTLLVSTDAAHSTSDILDTELGPEPQQVTERCWAMEIDPQSEVDNYIDQVKLSIRDSVPPRLSAEVEQQIDAARVSPGAEEAALFDRFTRIIDASLGGYDRIVFDTAPTGQTLRLLSLPELMSAWISGLVGQRRKVNILGRMWRNVAGAAAASLQADDPVLAALEDRQARFQRARGILTDGRLTEFIFILIPERLALLETKRAVEVLKRYHIPVGTVVVNKVLPDDAGGEFVEHRRVRQQEYLRRAEEIFGDYALYKVPLCEEDVVGVAPLVNLLSRAWG